MPPAMTFRTKMWHPNIYPDGKVCISILHPPGDDPHPRAQTRSTFSPSGESSSPGAPSSDVEY